MAARRCLECKRALPQAAHANRKRCEPCAKASRKRPSHTLTLAQQRKVMRLAGKMMRAELAERVGASLASCSRFARMQGISLDGNRYSASVVRQVCAYYQKHGRPKTEKRFPSISVRSIIERYGESIRQRRWTDAEIVKAAQMAGIVPFERQAEIFARPRAHAGSIKSLWVKKIKAAPVGLHGLSHWNARVILLPDVPLLRLPCSWRRTENRGKQGSDDGFLRIALWCDAQHYMRSGLPPYMRSAIKTMAHFQEWLYGSPNPRKKIMALYRKHAPR